MRHSLATIAAILMPAVSFAAPPSWTAEQSPTTHTLRAVRFGPGGEGYIAGDHGTILRSAPAGSTWQIVHRDTMQHIAALDVSPQGIITVGQNGVVFRSTDGVDWSARRIDQQWNLADVRFATPTTAVAVGTTTNQLTGVVARTTDAGRTWTAISVDVDEPVRFLGVDFHDDRNGMIVGETTAEGTSARAVIMATTDGGVTWEHRSTSTRSYYPKDIVMTSATEAIVVGTEPNLADAVLRVEEGGTVLQYEPHDGMHDVRTIAMDGFGFGTAAGMLTSVVLGNVITGPAVFSTTDGGATWSSSRLPVLTIPMALAHDGAGRAVVVGTDGTILRQGDCVAPALSQDLADRRDVATGGRTTLRIRLDNADTSVHYTWYHNGVALSGWDEPALNLGPAAKADAGTYRVVATGDCGFVMSRECTVTVVDRGVLMAQLRAVHFGAVPVGTTQDSLLSVAVRNDGAEPIRITGLRFLRDQPVWSFGDTTGLVGSELQPGQGMDIPVRVTPASVGAYRTTLVVETENDIDPAIDMTAAGMAPVATTPIRFQSKAVDFGRVAGGNRRELYTGVMNVGAARSTVRSLRIVGPSAERFDARALEDLPVTLDAGGWLGFAVGFTADDAEQSSATLVVETSHDTLTLPLYGEGLGVRRRAIVDLGAIAVGDRRSADVVLDHMVDLALTAPVVDPVLAPYAVIGTDPVMPTVRRAGQPLTVRVEAAPTRTGVQVTPVRMQWLDAEGSVVARSRMLVRIDALPATSVHDGPATTVAVAPQPAHDRLTVTVGDAADGTLTLRALDGRELRSMLLRGGPAEVDLRGLAVGVYLVTVDTGRKRTVHPVVVQ